MLSLTPYSTMPHSSSPLNPHRSSSPNPMSSPTPAASTPLPLTFTPRGGSRAGPSTSRSSTPRNSSPRGSSEPLSARYRPRRPTAPPPSVQVLPPDLFNEGTTPTQSAMWRERLHRRMKDRERRKRDRESDLARRRGTDVESVEDEDEQERQAQADDEEIFRRLMVLQRRREEHAALASLEVETGGSDPCLPEFWEEEDTLSREERALYRHLEGEDQWANEAAAAEEAEAEMWAQSQGDVKMEDEDLGDDEYSEADWAAIAAMTEAEAMDTS